MALDSLMPFTPTASAYREGLLCTLIYNQNATKRSNIISVEELFPYLKSGTPDWLEDPRVKKAKKLINAISCHSPEVYKYSHDDICDKIKEEIVIENNKLNPDKYVINKLKQFLKE